MEETSIWRILGAVVSAFKHRSVAALVDPVLTTRCTMNTQNHAVANQYQTHHPIKSNLISRRHFRSGNYALDNVIETIGKSLF